MKNYREDAKCCCTCKYSRSDYEWIVYCYFESYDENGKFIKTQEDVQAWGICDNYEKR